MLRARNVFDFPNKMDRFNHHMMTLARDARGLTQSELAEKLDVKQGTLSKYETGMHDPPTEFVSVLAESLGFPSAFFYEPGRPYGLPPFHYRRRKKLSAKALARIIAEMNIRRIHLSKMLISFNNITNGFIPEIDLDEYHGRGKTRLNTEDAARLVREMWMLPNGPIQNMVELLEENGGVVIPCDFGTDLLDAMSQRIDGLPILFFVNIHAPADRLRHTLAHELGHMVLHTIALRTDDEMEEEADAFAGAFLLPADEIKPQLRRFDLRQLANLKGYWKVSMAAIAVRASRLNLITPYQSKMFWMEMGRLGYRKREPNEPPREHPKLLRQMVAYHMNKLGYSVSEMAKLLHLHMAEFKEMYRCEVLGESGVPGRHPNLRVVK
jgi:Zn-dependent peptidase ImmA (M78 family)/transcriptional regulator with XRE-family HTH domain